MMKKLLSALIFVFIYTNLFNQNLPVLQNDYLKYIHEMDKYFENPDNKKSRNYKHYMRWRHEYATKVGTDGTIRNFAQLDIEAKKQAVKLIDRSQNKRQTHGFWEDIGPHDYTVSDSYSSSALGRVNCLAFHPTDNNILFAGSPFGGLWKTTDHGGSWQCITNNFSAIGVSDIAINPSNPDIIYIITGDGDHQFQGSESIGVLKTTNGGLSWKEINFGINMGSKLRGYCLRMHPNNPNQLFLGLSSNNLYVATLWVTNDAGETWYPRLSGPSVYDIEFKPGSYNTIYAATKLGIYKSIDFGLNFTLSNTGMPNDTTYARLAIATTPSLPDNLYVLCGGVPSSGTFTGLYSSVNSGATYNMMSNSPNILSKTTNGNGADDQALYDLCIAADPINGNRIFVGAINGWKSEDFGVTWSRETYWTRIFGAVDPFVHADWHNVYYRGSRIYSVNDGGIWYSDDQGNSWFEISSGLGITQFYNIDVYNGEWIGGTQDNGTNEATVGNTQMHNIWGGDGFGCTWHNSDHSIKIISSQGDIVRRQFGSNLLINQSDNNFWYNELEMATNTDHVFAFQFGTTLIRGHQNSAPHDWSWHDTGNTPFNNGSAKGFAQGISDPAIMYVASSRRLMKSNSIYTLPTAPWDSLHHPEPGLYYEKIIVDSFDANRIWVVCGGYQPGKKVYRSDNGGDTWTNISGSLPNIPMRRIVAKTSGIDELYVGTEIGVFYWNEIIGDWIYFSNGLPTTAVSDLKIDGGYIYAGTYGRGIWRSELYTLCPNSINLSLSDPYSPYSPGKQVYSASIQITSNRVYEGSFGTNITYSAENHVDLTEGFWAKQGTLLQIDNNGCP